MLQSTAQDRACEAMAAFGRDQYRASVRFIPNDYDRIHTIYVTLACHAKRLSALHGAEQTRAIIWTLGREITKAKHDAGGMFNPTNYWLKTARRACFTELFIYRQEMNVRRAA